MSLRCLPIVDPTSLFLCAGGASDTDAQPDAREDDCTADCKGQRDALLAGSFLPHIHCSHAGRPPALTAGVCVRYRRCHRMSVLSPLLPLTFLMGYQADLAYGSKMNRIQSESSLSLLCRDVVVVVSNEDPQMSPCISITAVVLYLECVKLFFWVHFNFLLLSCPMKSLRCLHTSLSQ
ncbi:PLGRKT [Cordylochernes scorpioides]|uniref:PLGRKT n=1 Tax=Cordylochernes scorpioides TaxID=51811 RepID=A0ABY6LJ00_9ARAC|nr:PLGRKT [Cordylochernes scorpioides]